MLSKPITATDAAVLLVIRETFVIRLLITAQAYLASEVGNFIDLFKTIFKNIFVNFEVFVSVTSICGRVSVHQATRVSAVKSTSTSVRCNRCPATTTALASTQSTATRVNVDRCTPVHSARKASISAHHFHARTEASVPIKQTRSAAHAPTDGPVLTAGSISMNALHFRVL